MRVGNRSSLLVGTLRHAQGKVEGNGRGAIKVDRLGTGRNTIALALLTVAALVLPTQAAVGETDAGNTQETGTAMAVPGSVSQTLSTWTDADWWSFRLPGSDEDWERSREVTISLTNLGADYDLEVYYCGWGEYLRSQQPGTASEEITFEDSGSGTCVDVGITSATAVTSSSPYLLSVSWVEEQPDAGASSPRTAIPLTLPATVSNYNIEWDYWKFALSESKTVNIALSGAFTTENASAELRDNRGKWIADLPSNSSRVLAAGVYVVGIEGGSQFRPYTLTINANEPPPGTSVPPPRTSAGDPQKRSQCGNSRYASHIQVYRITYVNCRMAKKVAKYRAWGRKLPGIAGKNTTLWKCSSKRSYGKSVFGRLPKGDVDCLGYRRSEFIRFTPKRIS